MNEHVHDAEGTLATDRHLADLHPGVECLRDRVVELPAHPLLDDRGERGSEVAAVVGQGPGTCRHLGAACRCTRVGAQVVVEAPALEHAPHAHDLRCGPRVDELRQDRPVRREGRRERVPGPAVPLPDPRAGPLDEQRRRPGARSGEHGLALDLGVVREGTRAVRLRQPEVDGVAELVTRHTEEEPDRFAAPGPGHRDLARSHRP